MKDFIQLLSTRDTDKVNEYIKEHPKVLDTKDSSGASGFLQLLYHRLPDSVEYALTIKKKFTFNEAIALGNLEKVRRAIEADEELVSKFCDDGFTPIALATFFSQVETAKYLFDSGGDPSICADSPMKVNAMHAAAAIGNFELMELFVSNGYDPNIPQMNNITPIQSSAYRGDLEMVKLLVRHGADPFIKSVDGVDAYGYAKEHNHEEVMVYLKSVKKK